MSGKLYLIPTTLGGEDLDLVVTPFVREVINQIDHYIVEKEKHSRRYLRSLDIDKAIQELTLYPLNKHTVREDLNAYLEPLKHGQNIGLISEAGCPGVADPGAEIVALAHKRGFQVVPLAGASSILLALMGSGFSGQHFSFHGYLPKDQKDRIRAIRSYESASRKTGGSHLFMDTPFRNMHVLEDLLKTCNLETELCIAVDLTMPTEQIKSRTIGDWKKQKINLHKRPCMFVIGRSVFR